MAQTSENAFVLRGLLHAAGAGNQDKASDEDYVAHGIAAAGSFACRRMKNALLLAPDTRCVPDAEAVPAKSGKTTLDLWNRAIAHWAWRLEDMR